VAVIGNYAFQLFIRHDVEVLRLWESDRPAGYWTPFVTPEKDAIFGFPLRNGWKTVAALYADGILAGRYATNGRESVADWYTRGQDHCPRDAPRYFMLVQWVEPALRPEVDETRRRLQEDYHLFGTVLVSGAPHLEIYARNEAAQTPLAPQTFVDAVYAPRFDAMLRSPWPIRDGPVGPVAIPSPTAFTFGEPAQDRPIRLLGYDLPARTVAAGDELAITLYWTAPARPAINYFVSVQVIDPADLGKAGQRDGEPGCNRFPTSSWGAGDTLADRYVVPIAADAKPQSYSLLVTLYTEQGALPVVDGRGQPVSSGAVLTDVVVTAVPAR
jgi:hypothetical protein